MLLLLILLLAPATSRAVGVSGLELKATLAGMDKVAVRAPADQGFDRPPGDGDRFWAALADGGLSGRRRSLIGGIGQVSVLNTFCHIHTPFTCLAPAHNKWTGAGIVLGTRRDHYRATAMGLELQGLP